jgi:hypothetical protein
MKKFFSVLLLVACVFSVESFAKKVRYERGTVDTKTVTCDASSIGFSSQAQIRKVGYRQVSIDGVVHYNHSVVFLPTAEDSKILAYFWLPGEDIRSFSYHGMPCASPFPPKDPTPPYYPDTYRNRN